MSAGNETARNDPMTPVVGAGAVCESGFVNDLQHVVVVGTNRYPGIEDLGVARADAFRFRDWLISPIGGDLPPENVELVTVTGAEERRINDVADTRPTQRDVNDALKRRKPAWERSRLRRDGDASGHRGERALGEISDRVA